MVGAIIGWVLLGLLALLLLLLFAPVSLYVRYANGSFTLKARILFVFIRLFPQKELTEQQRRAKEAKQAAKQAKKDAKKDAQNEEDAPKAEEPKAKRSFGQTVVLVRRLANAGLYALRMVLRHLRVRGVRLVLPVHSAEAADTAMNTGRLQAAVGTARGVLGNLLNVRYRQLEVFPDFTGQMRNLTSFSCNVSISPVIIVAAGVAGLVRFLSSGRKKRRGRKQAPQGAPTRAPLA